MFRNFNLAVLALFSTVSAKECYEASGKFIMTEGSVSASINVEMDICFPKSSANGQFGTGTGLFDGGSGSAIKPFTVTQAMLVNDKLLTLWLKEKKGNKTQFCSVMCELDKNDDCSGYFSCQPN